MSNLTIPHSRFSEFDIYLFKSGKHLKLYEKFGSHQISLNGQKGTYFAVYAPAAREVQVVGNFNSWDGRQHQLNVRWDSSGIWEGFIPDINRGELYKYRIYSTADNEVREKADPFSFYYEIAPKTSGMTWDTYYEWSDQKWLADRSQTDHYTSALSIYELHLGSWMKNHDEGRSLHYHELADKLVSYISDMGYTHVELLPVTEHPYYPSWGYLSTGFYAPTSRYGSPQDFMYLIDRLHQANIGVILDWVPAHFPSDTTFLADFDGTKVYEHPNPKKGYHPDWNSLIFNFERPEVCSFLLSSANFWLDRYHIDGLRVDAVASMLYLDYSRDEGEWDPNEYGGNHNLAAIEFLKNLNFHCYQEHPGITIIAEESTSYTGVTAPVDQGGLGFGFKWMMGWMNDTLRYFERDPIYREHHQGEISFSMVYAYSESYILPLSHDEVVHGKNSMIYKMPGDEWQQFANLRLLYAYMFTHPGHKLLFMGNDFAMTNEWNFNEELPWNLLDHAPHQGIQNLVRDLNALLKNQPALSEKNFDGSGFRWIDHQDTNNSVLVYARFGAKDTLVIACNFTPNTISNYRIGVPQQGTYVELISSDDNKYWGSGQVNSHKLNTENINMHGCDQSIHITLPPLGATVLKLEQNP